MAMPPRGGVHASSTNVNDPRRVPPLSRTSDRSSSGEKMPSRSFSGSPGK